ncbi:MAG TPA: DUF4239 domain-containing protein [Thermoanaerobaculia bacterium]|nr:DUF4239 domain-containing protein [Thermoanaerobaculia bacterium]HQR67008.1 DUF4239 domain-containing protein [Thermoanaerobaculia bacterium]
MTGFFGQIEPLTAAVLLALLMLGSWRVGFMTGRRRRSDSAAKPEGKFEDAVVAVLGLLLAFTFSMALSKYDRRREMLVADSNAIGDFYTCASLLRDPVKTKLQGVIREYAQLRLDVARTATDPGRLEDTLRRFQELQGRMTELVGEAVNEGTPVAVPLTNTLNDLTSAHAARLVAVKDRLPGIVVLLIFFASAVAMMLVGKEQGWAVKPPLAGTLSFLLLVALVVFVILDLNHPMKGFIVISQEPMQRVLESMGK